MIHHRGTSARVGAALLLALAVSACGGGGGGGGSPASPPSPPPPPPPPASTLTARATAPVASVQEGQPVVLDASGSTDTAGGALTFAWTQTAGPTATIDNAALAKPTITAAEVTADTPATFKVTVTSGSQTASANVNITFANIAQTPVFKPSVLVATATFSRTVDGIYGNQDSGFVQIPYPSPITPSVTTESFVGFHLGPSGDLVAEPNVSGLYAPPVSFKEANTLSVPNPFGLNVAVMSESTTTNQFQLVRKNPDLSGPPLLSTFGYTLDRPCAVDFTYMEFNAGLIIGQRNKGFTALQTSQGGGLLFSTSYGSITTGQSFCAVSGVQSSLASPAAPPFSGLPDVIAVDVDTNTIYHYAGTVGVGYTLKEQAPVQLNATGPMHLTAQTDLTYNVTFMNAAGNAGLAMTFTDGVHNGQHRLVVVGLDSNRNLVQITKSWALGVPTGVVLDDLDGNGFRELVVVTSTSPQAVVFESDLSLGGAATLMTLAPARYFEIGLGATQAISSKRNVLGLHSLFVAYRDLKQVRVFTAGP